VVGKAQGRGCYYNKSTTSGGSQGGARARILVMASSKGLMSVKQLPPLIDLYR